MPKSREGQEECGHEIEIDKASAMLLHVEDIDSESTCSGALRLSRLARSSAPILVTKADSLISLGYQAFGLVL